MRTKTQPPKEWKAGELVQVKNFGADSTVMEIANPTYRVSRCTWVHNGETCVGTFYNDTLQKASVDQAQEYLRQKAERLTQ